MSATTCPRRRLILELKILSTYAALPTVKAIEVLEEGLEDTNAILHVTC
jgi:hypothetical protein